MLEIWGSWQRTETEGVAGICRLSPERTTINHQHTTEDKYDRIFSSALSLKRAAVPEQDEWAGAVSDLLFTIINEWEKSPNLVPEIVLDAAVQVAYVWEDLVVGDIVEKIVAET